MYVGCMGEYVVGGYWVIWGQGSTLWGVVNEHTSVWDRTRQCPGVWTRLLAPKHTQLTTMYTCTLRIPNKWEGSKKYATRDTYNSGMRVEMNGVEGGRKTGHGHAPDHLLWARKKCCPGWGTSTRIRGAKNTLSVPQKGMNGGAKNALGNVSNKHNTQHKKWGEGGVQKIFEVDTSTATNAVIWGGHYAFISEQKPTKQTTSKHPSQGTYIWIKNAT